jgi:acyl-CoA reductase-like NAD-dependent aldehyde dehydrogenase
VMVVGGSRSAPVMIESLDQGELDLGSSSRNKGSRTPPSKYRISIDAIRCFASLDLLLKVIKEDERQKIFRKNTPLGVVAAITAWNFPVILLMIKVAPALLAGNTVVIKPAPTTPLTTLRFGELCAEVLPPGVVNVIVDQTDLGDALTSHPDVAKVAFTGSTAPLQSKAQFEK